MNKPFLALAWLAACFCFAPGCRQPAPEYEKPAPPLVYVATPVLQDMTLFLEANGETAPVITAEVRSRVRGYIEEIPFKPGDPVSPDTKLYVIEQTEYRNKLDAATASLSSAEAAVSVAKANVNTVSAAVAQAEAELSRQKQLLDSNATSPQEYETALAARDSAVAELEASRANVELSESRVLEAKAALAQAQLDFDYTTILAPIEGRISESKMDLGNLVENGSSLATVVDSSQVLVHFTISDRKLLDLLEDRQQTSPGLKPDWRDRPVFMRKQNETEWAQGALDYVDQEGIDRQTGTFAMRALVDNADRRFLPGMFVDVRLPYGEIVDALLVPQEALVKTPTATYLFVVNENSEIEQREVVLGQQLDGWVLVTSGLKADETFVVSGLQRIVPGKPVTPQLKQPTPPDVRSSEVQEQEAVPAAADQDLSSQPLSE